MTRRRTVSRTASALVGAVAILLALAVNAHAVNSPTAVTFGFDDGLRLAVHVPHGALGSQSPRHVLRQQQQGRHQRPHDVDGAGETSPTPATRSAATRSTTEPSRRCRARTRERRSRDDRTAIAARGYLVRNFAYPGGATNTTVKGSSRRLRLRDGARQRRARLRRSLLRLRRAAAVPRRDADPRAAAELLDDRLRLHRRDRLGAEKRRRLARLRAARPLRGAVHRRTVERGLDRHLRRRARLDRHAAGDHRQVRGGGDRPAGRQNAADRLCSRRRPTERPSPAPSR